MILALPGRALAPRASTVEEGVTVCHQMADDHSSLYTTQVYEVRLALQPCLLARRTTSLTEAVRATLNERYRGRVEERVFAHYIVVWKDGEWVTVCLGVATFEVDFGTQGKVEVETRSSLQM